MKPKAPIRRFDVFAEYNRQQKIKEGVSAAQAKGYGLWLAKIVAARRSLPSAESESEDVDGKKAKTSKWRKLSGKPQTDKLFDKEIVGRMGRTFYAKVFVPAISKAVEEGEDYRDIRDSIREKWHE